MSKILVLENRGGIPRRNAASGRAKIGLMAAGFLLIASVVASGAAYLYQVNDLAMLGYQMRDAAGLVQELERESKQLQIKEVELKSMYSIEKSVENLKLVKSADVAYVEINNSVAMK